MRGQMFLSERLEELLVEWCAAPPAAAESTSKIGDGLSLEARWFCPLDGEQMVTGDHGRPHCPDCRRTFTQQMFTTLVEIQPHN